MARLSLEIFTMRVCVVLCALMVAAAPASAQSTYVGGSLVGDTVRLSSVDYGDGDRRGSRDGEHDETALGFNLKIGRSLGERWGVEFEYARSGEFERRDAVIVPAGVPEPLGFSVPSAFESRSETTYTAFAALGWVRQAFGDRVELSYLAGVSFNQVESEHEYDGPRIQIFPPIVIPGFETTTYGVGPTVGVEAAVAFGSAAVTSGVRLQTTSGPDGPGWLVRPNVGLRWRF